MVCNIESIRVFFVHLSVQKEKKEKNRINIFFFLNSVKAVTLKERHGILIRDFTVKKILDISVN